MKLINLKIAFRNAQKHKVVSIAKIFGLSVSFAVIFFAAGYAFYEISFDRHIPGHEKIFRVYMKGQLNLEQADYAVTSSAMAKAMVKEIPEIQEAVRFRTRGNASFNYQDRNFEAGSLIHADTNFFSFFSMSFVSTSVKPLAGNDELAISKSLAIKCFGSIEGAMGKNVKIRGENCVINTVFDDFPENTHLDVQLIQSIQKSNPDGIGWGSQSFYTYIKTNQSLEALDILNFKLTQLVYLNTSEGEGIFDPETAKTLEDLKFAPNYFIHYLAEPLLDIHFGSHRFDPAITASKTYVYGAIIIALLILLISTINFLNLNLAGVSMRLREVGIRKTVGAGRRHVLMQFVQETNLFWIISFTIAIVLYSYLGPMLSKYVGFEIDLSSNQIRYVILGLFLLLLMVNLIINIAPLLLVSNKNPVNLLKEKVSAHKSFNGNNGLVFVQFVISLIIVIGALFVQKQINYMVSKDRGYDTDNVVMFSLYSLDESQRGSFIKELKKYPAVKAVGTSSDFFGQDPGMTGAHFNRREDENYFHTSFMMVDSEFAEAYNLEMLEGRFFEKNRKSDRRAVVINEATVREFRNSSSLLYNKIMLDGAYDIIGVVKDFNYRSLHHAIEPLVIATGQDFGVVSVKTQQNKAGEVIQTIQNLWTEYGIVQPFDYSFHNENLARQYSSDIQAKKLLLVLSIISIVIASMGLFAVSVFTITRKTKEIGIHKVNGAKVMELMLVVNRKFIVWILIALMVAIPLSYYLINNWLDHFAFKTPISWWVFILSGIIAFGIAVITVSFHSWRAARRNPVEALRYE